MLARIRELRRRWNNPVRCEHCRHVLPYYDACHAPNIVSRYQCRRFPPTSLNHTEAGWPNVQDGDWCFEYKG